MSWGQIAALIFAILLLLPGGCFLFFGVAVFPPLVLAAFLILGLAAWLFAIAFRSKPSAGAGEAPPPSQDPEP